MTERAPKVLLTGATGFIGGRLLRALKKHDVPVRCLVRSAQKFRQLIPLSLECEIVVGDVLKPDTLTQAMEGIDIAYYLIHSMEGRGPRFNKTFIERDRQAARNFVDAADNSGLKRIIYLGGLGETRAHLSEHLASRQEVARILQSGRVETTVLRAAVIIGAGGASFEILRYLVERHVVIICPRWISTRSQPIAVENVIEYLIGCLLEPATTGLSLDICGPQIMTYKELMLIYAEVRGMRRFFLTVPVLTPRLSSYWVSLMTPVSSGIVMPLVEGLKNEVICKDDRIQDLVRTRLIPMEEAICTALVETERGPGSLPSRQACFYGKDGQLTQSMSAGGSW